MKTTSTLAMCAAIGAPLLSGNAAQSTQPNILLIIADDASMNTFGAYGGTVVQTPAIDRLAQNGARFMNAYNCNPKCAPARACLLTGRYSWQLEAAANHWPVFPEKFKTYPQLLKDAGYHTGYTGKGWGPGTYTTPDNPAGPEYNRFKLEPPFSGIHDNDYATDFAAFLDEKPTDKPFCFWLGAFEPHRKYEQGSWIKAGLNLQDTSVPPFLPDNEIIRGDLLDYAVEVQWYDTQIGRAIQTLEDHGLMDNTLIIVTSDHGMPFPRIKGQIYEEGFHIPLIAYWKGVIQPGRVIDDFVNFPDWAPTFMEVAGLQPHPQMTGKSFLNLLTSPASGQIDPTRTYALLGKERHDVGRSDGIHVDLAYPVRAIRTKDFLYVHNIKPALWPSGNPEYGLKNCDGGPTKNYLTGLKPDSQEYAYYLMSFGKRPEEELYQIQNDPDCMINCAANPEFKPVIEQLRKQMEADLIEQQDPRTLGHGDVFDQYPFTGRPCKYE